MEKLKEEKILGTVPKNYQCVENFWDCPEFSKRNKSKKHLIHSVHSNFNGITLIALIITIVLNCSYLAMVEGKRIYKIIENRRNLLYNRLCN